ncbi:hypothetical protein FHY26_001830 [Xanthomonas campestris]
MLQLPERSPPLQWAGRLHCGAWPGPQSVQTNAPAPVRVAWQATAGATPAAARLAVWVQSGCQAHVQWRLAERPPCCVVALATDVPAPERAWPAALPPARARGQALRCRPARSKARAGSGPAAGRPGPHAGTWQAGGAEAESRTSAGVQREDRYSTTRAPHGEPAAAVSDCGTHLVHAAPRRGAPGTCRHAAGVFRQADVLSQALFPANTALR